MLSVDPHQLASERSRSLHVEVAERLRRDPTLVEQARVRVRGWVEHGSPALHYALAWQGLLDRPLEELLGALQEPSERMHDLRQVSPFAGVVDARTRWRIHREVRERVSG
jgi:hypothetical protein